MVVALAETSPPPTPGATPSAGAGSGGGGSALPGNPQNGLTLYGQNCASCHGVDMAGQIGPRLNPIGKLGNTPNPLDPAYLIGVITNGLSGVPCSNFNCSTQTMPPKGGAQLSDQDIKDIASYIIQQNKAPGEAALDPHALAIENVKWVTITILAMLILTYLLARYNMRWIDRRVAARRERIERQGRS